MPCIVPRPELPTVENGGMPKPLVTGHIDRAGGLVLSRTLRESPCHTPRHQRVRVIRGGNGYTVSIVEGPETTLVMGPGADYEACALEAFRLVGLVAR